MLWSSLCEMVCVALLGGMFGGALMALSNRMTNKFNMRCMEHYWNSDIKRLQSRIEALSQKISTNSVDNIVKNDEKGSNNNGYNRKRHFNQRLTTKGKKDD